jgi:hypothetical protein
VNAQPASVVSNADSIAADFDLAVASFESTPEQARSLRRMAKDEPEAFFRCAARFLDSAERTPGHRFVALLAIREEGVLERITDAGKFSLASAVRLFRHLLGADPTFDFRLARMLPGRRDAAHERVLRGGQAERAIDILDQTSPGPRLVPVLGHLTGGEDARIAAKAALFIGRRMNNAVWTAKQLDREDHRVRANALEATWGASADATIRILEEATHDGNNRVAGNALIGLYLAGYPGAAARALEMSMAEEPGRRASVAWAMGKMGERAFVDRLAQMLRDPAPAVRGTAIRSLAEIRKEESKRVAEAALSAPVEPIPVPGKPEEKETVELLPFNLKLDGSYKSHGRV